MVSTQHFINEAHDLTITYKQSIVLYGTTAKQNGTHTKTRKAGKILYLPENLNLIQIKQESGGQKANEDMKLAIVMQSAKNTLYYYI